MRPLRCMKQLRIIVLGKHRSFIMDLLDQVQATGYTVLCHRAGHGPVPEPPFIFNELETFVMITAMVPEDMIQPILAGVAPLFGRHAGVMFVSDLAGSRPPERVPVAEAGQTAEVSITTR
ncbi:P-II family nitrogen regulator [Candidatus Nitrospira bockiana]